MENKKKFDVQEPQKVKKSFWIKAKDSIFDFEKYTEMMSDKFSITIKYVLQMILVFAVVLTSISIWKFSNNAEKAKKIIKNDCKEYSFKDGFLDAKVDTDKIDLGDNSQLIINTNINSKIDESKNIKKVNLIKNDNNEEEVQEENKDNQENTEETQNVENNQNNEQNQDELNSYIDELNKHERGAIVLNDKVIVKDLVYNGLTQYEYSEIKQRYGMNDFDKAQFEEFMNSHYSQVMVAITLMVFVVDFFMYLAQFIMDAALLAILSFFICRILKLKLDFKSCANISVHALTLPVTLNIIYLVINALTGFEIQNFRWMYTTISYIYIIVAILIIKTDVITIQKQLIKIKDEEQEVKDEIEEEKRKQKEKEEEEKQKQEEDKKENKPKEKKEKKEKNKKETKDQKPATDGALFENKINKINEINEKNDNKTKPEIDG